MNRHQADAFSASRDEVSWFFAAAGAAMGLHAQNIDGGRSGTWDDVWDNVWDDPRFDRAHRARRSVKHRADVDREARIRSTLARMGPPRRKDLESVYTPFGASRTTWQAYCVFRKEQRPLLGLALRTGALLKAYARKHRLPFGLPYFSVDGQSAVLDGDGHAIEIPQITLLRWVEDEVAHLRPDKIKPGQPLPGGHRLADALLEATAREQEAIAEYEGFRVERVEAAKRANEQLLETVRAASRQREREEFDAKLAAERARLWPDGSS